MGIFDWFHNFPKRSIEKMKAKKDVKGLINMFIHRDESVQNRAVEALVEIGTPAVEPLIQTLKYKGSYSGYFRSNAAEALDKLGWEPKNNTEAEAYYLISKHQWNKLASMGTTAVEPLIQVLEDNYGDSRTEEAAKALGNIGDTRAVEPLIQVLKNEYDFARKEAVVALGKINDKRVVSHLLKALKRESHSKVRNEIIFVLGRIGDKKAAEEVINILFEYPKTFIFPESIIYPASRDYPHHIPHPTPIRPKDEVLMIKEAWKKDAIENLKNLFGYYTNLVVEMSVIEAIGESSFSSYQIETGYEAVKKLCEIFTPISSNILYLILERPKKIIIPLHGYSEDKLTVIETKTRNLVADFEPHQTVAREELKRRGNPLYAPSIFLDEEAWKRK